MTNGKGKPRKGRVVQLLSAGGVVFRRSERGTEIVLCGHRKPPPPTWGLPKGTPEPGESREETAIREVSEETGLEVEIEDYIGEIEYWFVRSPDRARCHKTVLYYMMRSTGGDVALHDHEFDDVQWFPVEEGIQTMKYINEVRVVEKALEISSRKDDD